MSKAIATVFAACMILAGLSAQSYGRQRFIQYWMSGYYNASKNNDVFDVKRPQMNPANVLAYCKKHKSEPLPQAINKNAT